MSQEDPTDRSSDEEKRAAIPTSPVLTTSRKIFPRFDTSVTSSYETAGETSNSFDSQICTISSEEAGRISVEVQESSAARLRAMSLKNTVASARAGAGIDATTTTVATRATTGYIIMDQAAEVAVSAEQPPLYDTLILPTIDLSAILDSSSSSTNDDNRRNTNGGGGRELNTPTMDMEEEDEEEVLGEFNLSDSRPITLHEGVLTELWNLTPPVATKAKNAKAPKFPTAAAAGGGKMMCVNPLDVEGRRKNKKAAQQQQSPGKQQQQQTTFEVTAAPTTGHKVTKGQRPKLRLTMPPPVKAEVKAESPEDGMEGLTPLLEETLGGASCSSSSFDLLAYVTDTTIKVDDPMAVEHMGFSNAEPVASTSTAAPGPLPPVTSDQVGPTPPSGKRRRVLTERAAAARRQQEGGEDDDEDWEPRPKRGRGRPPGKKSMPKAAAAAATTASDHSYGSAGGSSSRRGGAPLARAVAAAEGDSAKEAKYRRMRDLNNEASKRCRQNRKNKQANLEAEAEALARKNVELKLRVGQMEELLERLKSRFVEKVANPAAKE